MANIYHSIRPIFPAYFLLVSVLPVYYLLVLPLYYLPVHVLHAYYLLAYVWSRNSPRSRTCLTVGGAIVTLVVGTSVSSYTPMGTDLGFLVVWSGAMLEIYQINSNHLSYDYLIYK